LISENSVVFDGLCLIKLTYNKSQYILCLPQPSQNCVFFNHVHNFAPGQGRSVRG